MHYCPVVISLCAKTLTGLSNTCGHFKWYHGHSTLDRIFPVGRSATGRRVGAYGTWRSYLSAVGISHGCATHLEPTPKPEVSTVWRHKSGRGTFHLPKKRRGGWNGARRSWIDFRCIDVRIKHLEAAFYLLHNSLFIKGPWSGFCLTQIISELAFITIFLFVWHI